MMIKAIVFDFDGLILDTETPDYQSWRELYAEFGVELPLAVWHANIGSADMFNPYIYLEEQLGRSLDRQAIHDRRKARDNELLAAQQILPGVTDYLAAARTLGLRMAIASSSKHDWVDGHLVRLGLNGRFDAVLCRDDVGNRSKPDPAVYQAALNALGVTAAQALALEDSPNGARAALDAGLFCVAVPNQMTHTLTFPPVHYRLTSLDAMPLARLIEEVAGNL